MYGYENAIEYTPATESAIKDWAKKVLEFIREQGRRIRQWLSDVGNKIKSWFKKDNSESSEFVNPTEASSIIKDIEDSVTTIINDCMDNIYDLTYDYKETVKSGYAANDIMGRINAHYSDRHSKGDSSQATGFIDNKHGGTNGMDSLYTRENNLTGKDVDNWQKIKLKYEPKFKKDFEMASKLNTKLNEFVKMRISYGDLKSGYSTLKNCFSLNGKFGLEWSDVIMTHDWATGKIKEYLGEVVRLYHTGIAAVNILGKKLSAWKVYDESGKRIKNPNIIRHKNEKAMDIDAARKYYNGNYEKFYKRESDHRRKRFEREWDDIWKKTADESVNYMEIFDDSYFECDYDMFDEAFESGYLDAMLDAGYEYGEAMENMRAKIAGVASLTTITDIIYEIFKRMKIKSTTVISVPNMVKNGLKTEDAIAKAQKAVNFFKTHKYLETGVDTTVDESFVLNIDDLNEHGKLYMNSFYDACGKITMFDAEKCANKLIRVNNNDSEYGHRSMGAWLELIIASFASIAVSGIVGAPVFMMSATMFAMFSGLIRELAHFEKYKAQSKNNVAFNRRINRERKLKEEKESEAK